MDWELRLTDALSGPAARAAASLKPVEDKLRDVNKQLASSAIDKMTDGLKKQQAQLRLQRTDLAANLRAAKAQEQAEGRVQRVQAQARAAQARDERIKMRASESQARIEERAQASAARAMQRSAQARARVNEGVRRREVAALGASAREGQRREAAAQRASNAQMAAQNRARVASENRAQKDIQRAAQAAERDKAKGATGPTASGRSEGSSSGGDLMGQVGLLMKVAAAATAAAAAVATVTYQFGKAVLGAIDFRAGSIQAIDTLTKKSGEGARVFDMSMDLALKFNLDPQEAVRSVHSLISKGFTGDESKILLTAMADLRVLSPNANLDKVSLAIEQIKGKGKLQMEELQGQLAEAGVSTSLVLDQLAKKYGKSSDAIRKMISAGQIDAKEGVDAIVGAITAMGTGKLGEAAENAARSSLSGLANGIRTRLAMLPLEMAKGLQGSAGVETVKAALRTVLDALDPSKSPALVTLLASASTFADTLFKAIFGDTASADAGKTLQKIIQGVADGFAVLTTVVEVVGPILSAMLGGAGESLGAWYEGLRDAATGFTSAFGGDKTSRIQAIADAARSVGRVLGTMVVIVGLVAGAFVGLSAAATAAVASIQGGVVLVLSFIDRLVAGVEAVGGVMSAAGLLAGTNLWQGLSNGILAGLDPVTAAGSQLGNAAESGVRTSLDTHSPSRVMASIGGDTAEGFVQGVEGAQADVDATMNALVAPKASGAAGGTTNTNNLMAGGISVPITIQGADGGADGATLGGDAASVLLETLETWAMEMGMNPMPVSP